MDKVQKQIDKIQKKANSKHSKMNLLKNEKAKLEATPEAKKQNAAEIEGLKFEIENLRQEHRLLLAEVNSLKLEFL